MVGAATLQEVLVRLHELLKDLEERSELRAFVVHMGQFLQDGKNEQIMSKKIFLGASL